jgi:hypothetical protein
MAIHVFWIGEAVVPVIVDILVAAEAVLGHGEIHHLLQPVIIMVGDHMKTLAQLAGNPGRLEEVCHPESVGAKAVFQSSVTLEGI